MEQFHKRMTNIDAFETLIAELAIEKKYDSVICGHIHQPQKRYINTEKGAVTYLNSGDWVEHLTALEYRNDDWHIYSYEESTIEGVQAPPFKPVPEVMTNEIAIYLHSLTQPIL